MCKISTGEILIPQICRVKKISVYSVIYFENEAPEEFFGFIYH